MRRALRCYGGWLVALGLAAFVWAGAGLAQKQEAPADGAPAEGSPAKDAPAEGAPAKDAQAEGTRPALKAIPGSQITLACRTSAIGMDFEPFKTTKGTLDLVLTFSKAAEESEGSASQGSGVNPRKLGTWTASVDGARHGASLGVVTAKQCASGCVLQATPSDNFELWAPRPVMPSALGEDDFLTIATLDVLSLEFKATMFRGKELSVLEKGTCEVTNP